MARAASRSPAPDALAQATSWSVTLAIALTTTTSFCARRDSTILAARAMAAASSTEVPPNLMTIIARSQGAAEISLHGEQLGVEQGSARGAADGVVREQRELPVEQGTGPQPADRGRHAGAALHIEPRLRTVGSSVVEDGLLGRAREPLLLRGAAERIPRFDDLLGRRGLLELHGNRFRVA